MLNDFSKNVKNEIKKHIDKNEQVDLSRVNYDKVEIKKDLRLKFLKHGLVYAPSVSHHLDYNFSSLNVANETIKELGIFGIPGKLSITSKNRYIVYIVDGKTIMETLKLLGATKSYKEYEKIVKYNDIVRKINRENNFDTANIKKSANAALKQVNDIKTLLKKRKLESLNSNLRVVIEARLKYQTLPMNELCEKIGNISKSALNHRFIKIRSLIK